MRSSGVAGAVLALALVVAGCGGGGGGGGGASGNSRNAGPDTQGALLTILNYGRATSAKEVCPLLSKAYATKIGGGDPAKCGTLGQATLCPCLSENIRAQSLSVSGGTATAKAIHGNGKVVNVALVREGGAWKIDKLDPPHR
jgi:hypothetical protein